MGLNLTYLNKSKIYFASIYYEFLNCLFINNLTYFYSCSNVSNYVVSLRSIYVVSRILLI